MVLMQLGGEHLSTGECSISHTFQVQWETCDQALV